MGDITRAGRREFLRKRYLSMFAMLIDSAFNDKPQPFVFCDDVVLELYLEDEELHWRKCEGQHANTS
jgi:hypothetical protein